jgi:hypothetical protein
MAVSGTSHSHLRLTGSFDADAASPQVQVETMPLTVTTLLRDARRAVIQVYGPCAAGSDGLVAAWARRLAETKPMALPTRLELMAELANLFGQPSLTLHDGGTLRT